MLSSVKTGLSVLPSSTKAALICLGDMPGISLDVISNLISAYRQFTTFIILPEYEGETGHPVLIPHTYWPEIMDLYSQIGLQALMYRHSSMIKRVPVATQGVLLDIDTPEAYQNAKKKLL